ncbi:MAG: leucyl-tRNA synthetase [Cellvibrionaceae bacterium]|jgi:leucyl-tRNA synthetase
MSEYKPQEIEAKWQKKWEETELYRSKVDWDKPKHYALTMFPYPSGDLHIGHWVAMTPSDARARFMRMQGYNVLFPMGFDAFGLPAENAAVQRNIHPWKWTYANMERMRGQMRAMGNMFDWEREAFSCDPDFYKWDEWFFSEFYKNGLAYKNEALVNWSDALQTVLANEQVIDGKDERLGQPVVQKMMNQWFFRITKYADELLNFTGMDWPEPVKIMQTNWIGRSEGAKVVFKADTPVQQEIEIFTTRPDTLWGATFMVLSPEHPLVDELASADKADAIQAYRDQTAAMTEIERMSESKEKTGVFTGGFALNPVNGAKVPVWIADYVLMSYGTGAIMAVPAHDQRDFEFARKFELEIIPVILPSDVDSIVADDMEVAYVGMGKMINSGILDGLEVTIQKGRKNPSVNAAIDHVEAAGFGREHVNYRMRDWLISRQRYWGSPIPIVYKEDGGMELVDYADLPVVLPEEVDFDPSGRSPLTMYEPFLNTTDSEGKPARRETDTMDTFMGSSWYQMAYLSPKHGPAPFDPEEAAYWLPVDTYTGGLEHATMHLLYTRFFNKAMRDLGHFDDALEIAKAHGRNPEGLFDEPMTQLRNQGQILGGERVGHNLVCIGTWQGDRLIADRVQVVEQFENVPEGAVIGELMGRTENILRVGTAQTHTIVELKADGVVEIPAIEGTNSMNQLQHHLEVGRMSKSKGNVVNPDVLVNEYGADTVRGYLMFAFDWNRGGPWNSKNISGYVRFLHDLWSLGTADYAPIKEDAKATRNLHRATHQAIIKCTREMEVFSFNTSVAQLMAMRNTLKDVQKKANVSVESWNEAIDAVILMLAPVSPFITEELWEIRGKGYSIHQQSWPVADEELAKDDEITLIVQVNGKVRGKVMVPAGISQDDAKAAALAEVADRLEGKEPKKVIVIPGRLVNIVV